MLSRRCRWMIAGLLVIVAVAAWPAYRWWGEHRVQQWRADCKAAIVAEDWRSLEDASRAWLAWDNENGDAWLFLATAAQEMGDKELAVDCLNRLPDDHPKCVPALLQRVDLLMAENSVLDAENTAERIIRIEPGAGRAYKFLIYYSAMTLQRQKMIERIRQSIDYRCELPDSYAYLFTSTALKFQDGYFVNSEWLKRYPESELFTVAQAYFQSHSKTQTVFQVGENANQKMDECLKKYPRNIEVLAFYLAAAIEAGEAERVAALLSEAPPEAEQSSSIWAAKGWYHTTQNQFSDAEQAYQTALQKNPNNWRARHRYATVLRRLNKTEAAEKAAILAVLGKQIEREVLELPRTDAITVEILLKMAQYAGECGDQLVASGILRRIRGNSL